MFSQASVVRGWVVQGGVSRGLPFFIGDGESGVSHFFIKWEPPNTGIWSIRGRYASYWNAYFLYIFWCHLLSIHQCHFHRCHVFLHLTLAIFYLDFDIFTLKTE